MTFPSIVKQSTSWRIVRISADEISVEGLAGKDALSNDVWKKANQPTALKILTEELISRLKRQDEKKKEKIK